MDPKEETRPMMTPVKAELGDDVSAMVVCYSDDVVERRITVVLSVSA